MKVLIISGHEFINKQDNGGTQCSYRNYTFLKDIVGEENLYLIEFSNSETTFKNTYKISTYHGLLGMIANSITLRTKYSIWQEKALLNVIVKISPDVIFFDSSITGRISLKIKKVMPQAKIICFLHNVEHDYLINCIQHKGPFYILPFWAYSYNEKCIMKNVNVLMYHN